MIRATTGGVLRGYRTNLMNSFIRDNKARDTVLSQRVFNSYAEDPAAAAKAFRLRKSRLMTSSQLKICDNTYHKYQSAFASLQHVSELIDTQNGASTISTLKDTTLRMLNDPTGDARTQLHKVLDNLSDTIIQMMNQTYGDEFIFAGADGYNVPFTVKEEEIDGVTVKRLYYRDVPVDATIPDLWQDESGAFYKITSDGRYAGTGTAQSDELYLRPDGVKVISQEEYDRLYHELPELEDDTRYTLVIEDNWNPDTDIDMNQPTLRYEEAEDGEYYKTKEGEMISVAKYHELEARRESLLKNSDGTGFQKADENGIPKDDGEFYLAYDKDKLISKKDYDTDVQNVEKLKYLANEKRFVDIGLGFKEDENGELIETSAFNECLSGLTFLGYGLDEDGDPKNIFSIVQRLKEIADSVPDGADWSKGLYDEFDRMVGKLEGAASEFKTQFTNHSAGTEKLKNSYDMLEENVYSLKEQYANLEDVNMADAISSFLWAEYCYNAALRVGNSILSQSLMDYLS